MIVHCVFFRSPGSGGFDWFYKKADADKEWEEAKQNAKRFEETGYEVRRISVNVPTMQNTESAREVITKTIDGDWDYHWERAKECFSTPLGKKRLEEALAS